MFRAELKSRLSKIFGFEKTTFDAPSESFEQDTLFVSIAEAQSRPSGKKIYSKVMGYLTVFSQKDKMPYGFFNKRIQKADAALTRELFFFDMDVDVASSPARIQNISERRARFVFLYSADYDPNKGRLTSINMEETVNE